MRLRAEREDATVLAGGTFVGILLNQRLLLPRALLSLRRVTELGEVSADGVLRLGSTVTHRAVEKHPLVRGGWPALAHTFSLVASPRVRNQATVGGVLADADYASDPPAMFTALRATVVAASLRGEREIPVEELIVGHYETSLQADELITEVRVQPQTGQAVYRKFRSRSHEDRPCVAVAATYDRTGLRVVVGAVAERPQFFPEVCAVAADGLDPEKATEISRRYAEAIEPISDVRGSADYRRRVVAVEVRRALEALVEEPKSP